MNKFVLQIKSIALENKYSHWYINLINDCIVRGKLENIYGESHHIFPDSLGGPNDTENFVWLTSREHFIAHWLLKKMFEKGTVAYIKMAWAFTNMGLSSNKIDRYINSRAYASSRKDLSHTDETKQKISAFVSNSMWINNGNKNCRILRESGIPGGFQIGRLPLGPNPILKEKNSGKNNPMFGKKGKNNPNYGSKRTEEQRIKISKSNTGKKRSDLVKQKVSENNTNSFWITDGITESKIRKDSVIPSGWAKGRKPGWYHKK